MSPDKCANCSCADKTQCMKKGNSYALDMVETDKSYVETEVMGGPAAAENGRDGNCSCNCGTSCACVSCTCGGKH